jgi:hypothetical protein
MDLHIKQLFNNGDNSGNTTIISNDGKQLKCHSFILKTQSEFMSSAFNFKKQNKQDAKPIELDYNSKSIMIVLSRVYNSTYKISNDLSIDELIELVKLVDELLLMYEDAIITEISNIFAAKLTDDNWLPTLVKIANYDVYDELIKKIRAYYINIIRSSNILHLKSSIYDPIYSEKPVVALLLQWDLDVFKHIQQQKIKK